MGGELHEEAAGPVAVGKVGNVESAAGEVAGVDADVAVDLSGVTAYRAVNIMKEAVGWVGVTNRIRRCLGTSGC